MVRLPSQIGQVRSLQNNGNHNESTDAYLQSGSSPPIPPRLLTIKQAAPYCACGVSAIRQAIVEGTTACTIGRRFLIMTSLDSFIDAKFKERAA